MSSRFLLLASACASLFSTSMATHRHMTSLTPIDTSSCTQPTTSFITIFVTQPASTSTTAQSDNQTTTTTAPFFNNTTSTFLLPQSTSIIFTNTTTTPTTLPPSTQTPDCQYNNCLRHFLRNASATPFCATYTTTLNTMTTSLPDIVSICDYNPDTISSACSCIGTDTAMTTATSTTSSVESSETTLTNSTTDVSTATSTTEGSQPSSTTTTTCPPAIIYETRTVTETIVYSMTLLPSSITSIPNADLLTSSTVVDDETNLDSPTMISSGENLTPTSVSGQDTQTSDIETMSSASSSSSIDAAATLTLDSATITSSSSSSDQTTTSTP